MTRDLNGLRAALRQSLPDSDIRIEGVGEAASCCRAAAASPGESQQAFDIASRLVGDGTKVVNGITVRGRDQVMLKVTVAEVQRDVIKQLGIDLSGTLNYGSAVVNFNSANRVLRRRPCRRARSLMRSFGVNPTVNATLAPWSAPA